MYSCLWIIQKIRCMNSIQEPCVSCVCTHQSLQRNDFVCVVAVSKFSMSASVTKRCLAALADPLTAVRMTELPLKEFSDHARLCLPLLAAAEMAVLPGSLWLYKTQWKTVQSYSCAQDVFSVCLPLEDVEVCEKCWQNGRSHLLFMSSRRRFVRAVLLLAG